MRAALGLGVLVSVVAAMSCAGSRNPGVPDAGTASPAPDAPVIVDAPLPPPPDAPGLGFGEPCTDKAQCASHICIFVATGGTCSALCNEAKDCPAADYGCFDVLGAVIDGQVASVCVPTSTQLCSVCEHDSECTLVGMDKCLTEDTGRSYCSRDCSTVGCPTGFDCENQVIDNVNYKQCVPHSQACDCRTADQAGGSDACSIAVGGPAPGTCAGTRTCGGEAGWGACQPPSTTDVPDGNYADDNCDGIDGDITQGIFVATNGSNAAGCGTTFDHPCLTLSVGLDRAVATGRPNLYVQKGTYQEVVVMRNGVSIWGGYDARWQRGPASDDAHQVTIVGQQDTAGDGEFLTVRARDLTAPVTIADVILQGPNAQGVAGASGLDGRSSYVVHAKGARVSLVRVQLVAGNGARGAPGSQGAHAPNVFVTAAMDGKSGGNGIQEDRSCDDTTRGQGGLAGTNTCPGGRLVNGGAGGRGGTMDENCPLKFTAQGGDPGKPAALVIGSFGTAGVAGTGGNACASATSGQPGTTTDGDAGVGGSGGYLGGAGQLYWYAHNGTAGGVGLNGTGGGGGGGGGGCDNGTDASGGGGGGGGAGGCAALGGGGGGGGGGGSFGVASLAGAAVTLDSCSLLRGAGGMGGMGGTGGQGQAGGVGGQNGAHPGAGTPGVGGAGAHGGHAGGGGGGQGGVSSGLLSSGGTIIGTCAQNQGAGGPSGPGGLASGTNQGGDGASGGAATDSKTCVSATNC